LKALKIMTLQPTAPREESPSLETIVLGGGCFWCLEGVFLRVRGVVSVESGYCNGHVMAPTYEQVCTGETGHAEVVKLGFDPREISLRDLLTVFFTIHDPTTLNRQGNDVGTQYRSGIYVSSDAQANVARAYMADLIKANPALEGRITTELCLLENYSAAEPMHHQYYDRFPTAGYCAYVIAPKIEKFLTKLPSLVA